MAEKMEQALQRGQEWENGTDRTQPLYEGKRGIFSEHVILPEFVEEFCRDRKVIGEDTLGGMKLAYVMGERPRTVPGRNLQINGMNLQKLFVKLTEDADRKTGGSAEKRGQKE